MYVQDRQMDNPGGLAFVPPATRSAPPRPLHRLAEVRRAERVSLKRVARRLHANLADVRSQEQATSDLSLHTLYQWAEALNVPVTELLFEPDSALSMPVMRRAQAIRMMKTARAILEHGTVRVRRMAEMMINQLIEMMPELKEVEAWPAVGSRRRGAVGRAACQVIPASLLTSPPLD